MNKEDIIAMAKEAGLDPDLWNYTDAFERFAALVASVEREACAKICEKFAGDMTALAEWGASQCANAIRARNKE